MLGSYTFTGRCCRTRNPRRRSLERGCVRPVSARLNVSVPPPSVADSAGMRCIRGVPVMDSVKSNIGLDLPRLALAAIHAPGAEWCGPHEPQRLPNLSSVIGTPAADVRENLERPPPQAVIGRGRADFFADSGCAVAQT